jgi:hypothetical protein
MARGLWTAPLVEAVRTRGRSGQWDNRVIESDSDDYSPSD